MNTQSELTQVSELDSKQAMVSIAKTLPALLAVSVAVGAPPLAALLTASIGAMLMSLGSVFLFSNWRTRKTSINWPLLAVMAAVIASFGYAQALAIFMAAGIAIVVIGATPISHWVGKTISPIVMAGVMAALALTTIVNQVPLWFGMGVSAQPAYLVLWDIVVHLESINGTNLMIGIVGLFMLGLFRVLRKDAPPTDIVHWFPIMLFVLVSSSVLAVMSTAPMAVAPYWHMVSLDISVLSNPIAWNYIAIITVMTIAQIWESKPQRSKDTLSTTTMLGITDVAIAFFGGLPMTTKFDQEPSNHKINTERILAEFAVYACLGVVFISIVFISFGYISTAGAAVVTMGVMYRYTRISLFEDMWDRGLQTFVVFMVAFVISMTTQWLLVGILVAALIDAIWTYREQIRPVYTIKVSYKRFPGSHCIYLTPGNSFQEEQSIQEIIKDIPENEPLMIQVIGHSAYGAIAKQAHISPRVRALLREVVTRRKSGIVVKDASGEELIFDGIVDEYPMVPQQKDGILRHVRFSEN
jgi:MFS superfamily sulfate permease-like transporter